MAELKPEFRGCGAVDEIDDALPRRRLFVVPQTETARRDAGVRRHAGHFAEQKPGAAERAAAEMHQMEIVRHAVLRRIHRHRRHDDAVLQLKSADRYGVNIGGTGGPLGSILMPARAANQRS